MTDLPIPDVPNDLTDFPVMEASGVSIRTVGCLPNNNVAEVLASDQEGQWFRFYLKRTSRVVRLFYKACNVSKRKSWLEGCVESRSGVGNYELSATVLGHDVLGETGEQTFVLKEVTLREG